MKLPKRPDELTPDDLRQWEEWLASRPPLIRDMAEKHPPWKLFRLRSTSHVVFPMAYNENGTFTVGVTHAFNPHLFFERAVFGVPPEELIPVEP